MREKPISIYALARKNLIHKPFRTGSLIVIMMIFAALLFGGSVLTHNLSRGIQGMADRLGADIMLVPYGYEKDLQVALLRGEPSSFYLKADLQAKLSAIPGVSAVSAQLFLASLDAGCCTAKVQLIGYQPESDFVITPWMNEKVDRPLQDNEVIVGSKILANVGEQVQFFDQAFTVVAKMASTGMGFDTSVFMSLSAAHNLMTRAQRVTGDTDTLSDYVSSLFIRVTPDAQPKQVVNRIMQQFAVDYNLDFILTKGMMSTIYQWLTHFAYITYGIAGLFWLLALLVITLVFSSSLNERKREISLLRILGASRRMLVKMIISESVMICLMGGLSGIALAGMLLFGFNTLICQRLGLPCAAVSAGTLAGYALVTLGLSVITGPLASSYSALSLTRFDSYSSWRAGE